MITSPTEVLKEKAAFSKEMAVRLEAVSKKYPSNLNEFWALKDVCLDVSKGEVVGIIGRNGAGKTTLLNTIAGILNPTFGKVMINGKVLGLFNLGVGFQDELTGRENIFLNGSIIGAAKQELQSKLAAIIEFSELGEFIDMHLGSYSQGMRLRLAFSIIANLDFDILLTDEVFAVGDISFQSKCFERLMDFRRLGKTLIITTQDMGLIERLCDKAALFEHGKMLFCGEPLEAINKYRAVLDIEKFYAGEMKTKLLLFSNTKKWAQDIEGWGIKTGTKEVRIDLVRFTNKFGFSPKQFKSRAPLKIKVDFTVKNDVFNPHFGVAIFRKDGVYCYGPNTRFDGVHIPELVKGAGSFTLEFSRLCLAEGEYKISIAIWDKNEVIAFDYHNACYDLIISASDSNAGLLNIPYNVHAENKLAGLYEPLRPHPVKPDLAVLTNRWGEGENSNSIQISGITLLSSTGCKSTTLTTCEQAKIQVELVNLCPKANNYYLWVGIYRDDRIYCQGISTLIRRGKNIVVVSFPEFALLPGGYSISCGAYDIRLNKFLAYQHGIYRFNMVFNRQDHGTVCLAHKWLI